MKKIHAAAILAPLGLLLALPAFVTGGFPLSHDMIYVLTAWKAFSTQLFAGEPYPRWIASHFGGRGSPMFFFYPPLSFYFATLFAPLADPRLALGAAAAAGLILSGYAAFFWLKKETPQSAALAGALAYMAAPYHLYADFYVRGAYAEFMACIWLPLVFLGLARLDKSRPASFVLPALAWAGLCATHLPGAVLSAPFIGAYVLYRRNITAGAGAILLGTGLAAICLVPALGMMGDLDAAWLWQGGFDHRHWYLCLTGCQNGMALYTALAAGQTLVIAALLFLAPRRLKTTEAKFWACSAAAALFLMTPLSGLLWDHTPLGRIQFPFRFMMIEDLALAYAVAAAFSALQGRQRRTAAILLGILFFSVLSCAAIRLVKLRAQDKALETFAASCLDAGCAPPEYAPAGLEKTNFTILHPAKPAGTQISARHWRLQSTGKKPAVISTGLFSFPGWVARDAQTGKTLPLSSDRKTELLSVSVPAGTKTVDLTLDENGFERAGKILSLLSLAALAALARKKGP